MFLAANQESGPFEVNLPTLKTLGPMGEATSTFPIKGSGFINAHFYYAFDKNEYMGPMENLGFSLVICSEQFRKFAQFLAESIDNDFSRSAALATIKDWDALLERFEDEFQQVELPGFYRIRFGNAGPLITSDGHTFYHVRIHSGGHMDVRPILAQYLKDQSHL